MGPKAPSGAQCTMGMAHTENTDRKSFAFKAGVLDLPCHFHHTVVDRQEGGL